MASELDKKLIQNVLRKHEEDDSIEILDLVLAPGCEKGNNFIAIVNSVSIHGVRKIKGEATGEKKKTRYNLETK